MAFKGTQHQASLGLGIVFNARIGVKVHIIRNSQTLALAHIALKVIVQPAAVCIAGKTGPRLFALIRFGDQGVAALIE